MAFNNCVEFNLFNLSKSNSYINKVAKKQILK